MEDLNQQVNVLENSIRNHGAFNNPKYEWSKNDFELGQALGRGQFGRVHLGREKQTGYLVAIKALRKLQITKAKCEMQVLREIEIHSHLKHPNIIRLLTYFHDDKWIFMVQEYAAGGHLFQHLNESPNGRFPEATAAKYIYQVADALEYCHQNNVIHRDIKPENLLLSLEGNVKLADFGWSVHAPSDRRKTMCGTVDYICPEMINGEVYNASVDYWCVGVLLYEFLVGNPPFETDGQDLTFKRILSLDMTYPDYLSSGAKDLISQLLKLSSKERLSPEGVKSHPWVKQYL